MTSAANTRRARHAPPPPPRPPRPLPCAERVGSLQRGSAAAAPPPPLPPPLPPRPGPLPSPVGPARCVGPQGDAPAAGAGAGASPPQPPRRHPCASCVTWEGGCGRPGEAGCERCFWLTPEEGPEDPECQSTRGVSGATLEAFVPPKAVGFAPRSQPRHWLLPAAVLPLPPSLPAEVGVQSASHNTDHRFFLCFCFDADACFRCKVILSPCVLACLKNELWWKS